MTQLFFKYNFRWFLVRNGDGWDENVNEKSNAMNNNKYVFGYGWRNKVEWIFMLNKK